MAKKGNNKRKEVLKLLRTQKSREVKELESYKLIRMLPCFSVIKRRYHWR